MTSPAITPGQLALLRYRAYPSEQAPCFSHLLICSTAPLEAERPYRRGLDAGDFERSAEHLVELRRHLDQFFRKPGAGKGNQRLRLVVRIHGYNVPLASVKLEYDAAERKFQADALGMAKAPPDDYVLFVHYAWPSERIGAGGPLRWIRAMPVGLLLLLGLGGVLGSAASGVAAVVGQLLLGIGITLTLLRMVVYFRDRDRAGTFGVFDAVEMIRALHHLVQEISTDSGYLNQLQRGEARRISLSFLGHSMGTFLTTSLIRVLSNVFDTNADSHFWENNPLGPFAGPSCPAPESHQTRERLRSQRAAIGQLFILDRLILVAADIPVWAITTGRSNYLASCLRRFSDTFLFVNDADMVLRLASTLANYFVFPSGTRMGGYRLGNLSIQGRGKDGIYGWRASDLRDLELHGVLRSRPLCEPPFHCPAVIGYPLNVIDCTDYTDQGRHLSAFTAGNTLLRPFNYAATLVLMLLAPLGIGQIDSHGGYFRGRFCLDLLYDLALRGVPCDQPPSAQIQQGLKEHRISWISIPSDAAGGP
ncbi:MAG: alpha/beta hydrolase [Cyanobium sp. M30B3]|jgi:hypothetical protein|nr:MAG: alpha/beta hydrolase [Cyanobium sp. M30B3]